jgi:hypothetical protein
VSPFLRALLGIVALGIALRVVHTLAVAPWPPPVLTDELWFNGLAGLLAEGHGFIRPFEFVFQHRVQPTAEHAPLYPVALAGVHVLGGDGPDAHRLLGALLGGGTIAIAGLLGRRLAGDRAGLLAAGIAAVYPILIATDGAMMSETLYVLLVALALLAAYRLVEQPRPGRAVLLGAVCGLAALTRGEALLLLVLLLVPVARRPGGGRTALVAAVSMLVVLAPWTVRNWIVFDRPVLIATDAGSALAGANCAAVYAGHDIGHWNLGCVGPPDGRNEAVRLGDAGRRGVDYALEHARRLPIVMAARFATAWGLYDPLDVPEGRSAAVMHAGMAMYALLVPLAIYGLVLLRRRGAGTWIVAAPIVLVTITAILVYGNVRLRSPAEVSIVVCAGVGIEALWRRAGAARAGVD